MVRFPVGILPPPRRSHAMPFEASHSARVSTNCATGALKLLSRTIHGAFSSRHPASSSPLARDAIRGIASLSRLDQLSYGRFETAVTNHPWCVFQSASCLLLAARTRCHSRHRIALASRPTELRAL